MTEFVSLHTSDEQPGIATLLLSRPPTNALTRQVYRETRRVPQPTSGRRDDVRAVILFGGHEIFSAGDDVPELRTLERRGAEPPRRGVLRRPSTPSPPSRSRPSPRSPDTRSAAA